MILPSPSHFDARAQIAIFGGGACGLVAGLRAIEAGAETIVLERDARPQGSTALSSGFIPAPATRYQRAMGIRDTPDILAADIQKKAAGGADQVITAAVAKTIGPTLEWLDEKHGLEWIVLDDFLYPGHSRHRMHAVREKTGAALITRLSAAAGDAGLPIVGNAHVTALFADGDRITGVQVTRPDGRQEALGCETLILACNGFGGNPDLVARHIPDIADALYFGHRGNTGDAITWGAALGAACRDLTAYQGHGSVAVDAGVLITWALMMEGGVQVNTDGKRFSNEHDGYSEQSVRVIAQPGGSVWNIYDERIHQLGLGFPDYVAAVAAGAVREARDCAKLAEATGLPVAALSATLDHASACAKSQAKDPHGRDFTTRPPLTPPYFAIKVTGALFHTQGGLCIDSDARVLRPDGTHLPNLLAGGGAACGVSGALVEGYLSGNGLLTAIALGDIAGRTAASLVQNA